MKKHLLLGMAAIVSWFATSCQNEIDSVSAEKTSTVSFKVETPEIKSRAYSDGKTATVLQYAVYDAAGNELTDLTVNNGEIHGSTTVNLTLTTGNTYSVIFWAAAPNAPYTVDFAAKTMTVDYVGAVSNDENRDAFYAYVEPFTVTGAMEVPATLKRPFAQLNIGTEDYAASASAGYTPTKSKVTVKNIYSTLALFNGTVSNETEASFDFKDINKGETFPVPGYEYLAMNYLLVNEEILVDVEFSFKDDNNNLKTRKVGSVPLERNHRTNIYGQLLTSDVDINVVIKPEYDGKHNYEPVLVHNALDLQKALDAVQPGETTTIWMQADIDGDVIEYQKADRNVTIDGRGYKYNGTIKIHNGSNYNNGTLTIKNVNFETSTSSLNFIMPNNFDVVDGVTRRYSNNVTVEGCTFKANDGASKVVGIQAKASKNLKISNCTAKNMHSLLQAESCDDAVTVENVETVNCQNSVSFNNTKNAKISGSTLVSVADDGYGIRIKGECEGYALTVENCNISAAIPVLVRNMTAKSYDINFEGDNTLNNTNNKIDPYQVVISKTDYSIDDKGGWMSLVKPTGEYELNGADNFNVYPRDYYTPVSSWDEFTAALAANVDKIKLAEDITYDANYQLQKAVKIDLNSKSMTLPMINIHTATTVKNGTINGKVYARKNSEIVFNNVKFSGAVADNLSTEGHLAIQGGCKSLYAKDCLFSPTSVSGSQTKPLSFEGGSTIMKFEGCEFKSIPYKKQVYFNSLSATGSLDFTNCNFNNKTPNIMFAPACPLTNLTMNGTTKLSSVTLETNRAKDAVTAEDLAYLRESLIANNSMSSVRLFYTGNSSEYIYKN